MWSSLGAVNTWLRILRCIHLGFWVDLNPVIVHSFEKRGSRDTGKGPYTDGGRDWLNATEES